MKSIVFDIFVGIVTWIICEFIKFVWCKLTNSDNTTTNSKPYYNPKTLSKQYYISALVCIIIFIILARFNTLSFGRTALVVLFFMSIFLNWCAFECMHEIVKYFESEFKDDDSNGSNQ